MSEASSNLAPLDEIRRRIESEEDVKKLHRLVLINGGYLYLIETPFKTFPRYVVGTADSDLKVITPILKCGERWTADQAFDRTLNPSVSVRPSEKEVSNAPDEIWGATGLMIAQGTPFPVSYRTQPSPWHRAVMKILDRPAWQTSEPPKDRPIVIIANLVCNEGGGAFWCEPVCAEVQWKPDPAFSDWCFVSTGLSVRQSPDDVLKIRHWIDLPKEEVAP